MSSNTNQYTAQDKLNWTQFEKSALAFMMGCGPHPGPEPHGYETCHVRLNPSALRLEHVSRIMARTQTTGPDVTMNQNAFSGLIGALAQMATPRGPSASARRLGPGTYPGFGNACFRAYRADRATGRDSGNFKLRRKGYQPRPDQAEGRREHKNKKRTRRNRKAKQEPEPKIEAEDMTIGDPIHADVAMDDNTSMVAQDGSIFADSEDTMSINNDEYELEEDNGFNAAACKLINSTVNLIKILVFRLTSNYSEVGGVTSSSSNSSSSSSSFQQYSNGYIVKIPGPQILGYMIQTLDPDQTELMPRELPRGFFVPDDEYNKAITGPEAGIDPAHGAVPEPTITQAKMREVLDKLLNEKIAELFTTTEPAAGSSSGVRR
ncbi:hypothetical protein GGX14DRAFT_574938 [Mycena pura]|uniref:Uncharacterized protein n=1 Tax=Mycena pura TaxID=153505 RepID=A0AAD6Y184_9AGAR|nr:hypothetical protein GGX14DRAFT_574938 [Mycena pura]